MEVCCTDFALNPVSKNDFGSLNLLKASLNPAVVPSLCFFIPHGDHKRGLNFAFKLIEST